MKRPEIPFDEIFNAIEQGCSTYLEEALLIKTKTDALHFVAQVILEQSYLGLDEEAYYTAKNVEINKEKVNFGTFYPELQLFTENVKSSENINVRKLFEKIRFFEEKWKFSINPNFGSVTMYVFKFSFGVSRSPYYEDPNLRKIQDDTDEKF